jgi:hypothetical protein
MRKRVEGTSQTATYPCSDPLHATLMDRLLADTPTHVPCLLPAHPVDLLLPAHPYSYMPATTDSQNPSCHPLLPQSTNTHATCLHPTAASTVSPPFWPPAVAVCLPWRPPSPKGLAPRPQPPPTSVTHLPPRAAPSMSLPSLPPSTVGAALQQPQAGSGRGWQHSAAAAGPG